MNKIHDHLERAAVIHGWRRHDWMPLAMIPAFSVIVGLIYIVITTPMYSASAFLIVEASDVQNADELTMHMSSHIEVLGSNEITEMVVESDLFDQEDKKGLGILIRSVNEIRDLFGLGENPVLSEQEIQTLANRRVKSNLDVWRVDDTALIGIRYQADSPTRAADIANSYAQAFIKNSSALHQALLGTKEDFIASRIEATKDRIEASYQEAKQLSATTVREQAGFQDLENRIAHLNLTLTELDKAEAALAERIGRLRPSDDLTALEAAALEVEGGASIFAAYSEALTTSPTGPARDAANITPDEPTDGRLNALRAELDRLIAASVQALTEERDAFKNERNRIEGQLREAVELKSIREWSRIKRAEYEAQVFETIYTDYLQELENSFRSAAILPVALLAPARPDPNPVWPLYKTILLLSLVLGVALNVLFLSAREFFRTTGRLRQAAGTMPTLQEVWARFDRDRKDRGEEG